MAESTVRERPSAAPEAGAEAGHESESPPAELPEWLARELFKIFV